MKDLLFIYGVISLGVLISVMLPVLKQYIIRPKLEDDGELAGGGGTFSKFLTTAKPYLITGLFSLVVGLLLMAFLGDNLEDWRAALLAGYAGDSTLQRLRN